MLGQISLFKSEEQGNIRNRVELIAIDFESARYMLTNFHYLKRARTGRQINYAVLFDNVVEGVITYARPFTTTKIEGIEIDRCLEFARLYLVNNRAHVASCSIGKSLKRICKDWMLCYPESKVPVLVVSWSDRELHKGTIYKAANFIYSGSSRPRPHRTGRWKNYPDYFHSKDRWVYWLDKTMRKNKKTHESI